MNMKQPTRPATELPAKAPATPGFISCAAAFLCATLLLCIAHPRGLNLARADSSDEDVWQGTVTVVRKSHSEGDKTEVSQPLGGGNCSISDRHVSRTSDGKTTTYSDFRLLPDTSEGTTKWAGTARVNVSFIGGYYKLHVHKDAPCYKEPGHSSEEGYETTTSGQGVGQGEVMFFRYTNSGSRKATCHFEADVEKEVAKIPEVGHRWDSNADKPVNQAFSLLAGSVFADNSSFDCDPDAKSYSGEKRAQSPDGTSTEIITWNISHRPSDVEAVIVPPDNYDSWIPEGGENEDTPANTIVVRARVHKKGQPKKASPQAAKFKFQLVEVSKEQGVCLNWPREGKSDFDLKIQPELNDQFKVASDGQSAESKGNLKESSVIITSYDWGAYGKLKVTAIYEDGHEEEAHVEGDASKGALTIPKDDNGNHIADFWEKHYAGGKSDAKADDDLIPIGDSDKGDGLSLYEEYRGFRVQGEHVRTNPILKDLFIYDPETLGLGLFSESELTTHIVDWNEFKMEGGATNPRVINFNRGFGTRGPQHVLRLKNEVMPGLYGLADGTGPGPPKTCSMVKIDVATCLSASVQRLSWTIAHELAHACNVWHHGDIDYNISKWRELQPDGTWGVWLEYPDGSTLGVAAPGGQESGVEECIMRYTGTSRYESAAGPLQWQKDGALIRGAKYPPYEPPGTIFCDQVEGTGVNAPRWGGGAKVGNASRGKCKSQFCVNDTKH